MLLTLAWSEEERCLPTGWAPRSLEGSSDAVGRLAEPRHPVVSEAEARMCCLGCQAAVRDSDVPFPSGFSWVALTGSEWLLCLPAGL